MMRLAIAGAAGRMGRTLTQMIHQSENTELAGGLERPGSSFTGSDMGELSGIGAIGVKITGRPEDLLHGVDGIIDFTTPDATMELVKLTAKAGLVHIIGTTGMSTSQEAAIKIAANKAVIVKSGNMSLGVNLLAGLVKQAAAALGPEYDIEILEMHHRAKVDAPSGTALLLGEAAAEGRGIGLKEHSVLVRNGHTGVRMAGKIGFASLRGGSVVGDHNVIFAGDGDRLELIHRAESRDVFARGALKAAVWARGKNPGLYTMADVLGLQ